MFEEQLTKRLLEAVPVAAIFGVAVNWQDRPDGSLLPALTLSIAADPREYNHDNPDEWQQVRVQVDSRAESYLEAKNGLRAVLSELESEKTLDSVHFDEGRKVSGSDAPKETLEGGTKVFRITMDVMVPFRSI